MAEFRKILAAERDQTNAEMVKFFIEEKLKAKRLSTELVELLEEIERLAMRGGKRARSMLVRWAYKLAGGRKASILKASLYVELVHLYLLIHDDIADRDLRRYGGETLEVVFGKKLKQMTGKKDKHYGKSVAMVAGDLLNVLAHKVLVETDFEPKLKIECVGIMNQVLEEVVAGWYMHQKQNKQKVAEVDEESYLKGMELVSASYSFRAPLAIGLALAEAGRQLRRRLSEYAYHVGMAFQMRDDILGVFGDSRITGKPVGNDLREGKKTLLVLRAYKKSNSQERRLIESLLGNKLSETELKRVQDLIRSKSLEEAESLARWHATKAKEELGKIEAGSGERQVIENLARIAEFAVERNY